MTIHYINTSEDALAWNTYRVLGTASGRRELRRVRIFSVLVLMLVTLFVSRTLFPDEAGLVWPAFTALVAGLVAGIHSLFTVRSDIARQTRMLEKEDFFRLLTGWKEVSLQPDGLHTAWSEGKIIRNWESLQRWTSTDTHLVFHWSENDFSLIPKRAFQDGDHLRAFLNQVEEYRQRPFAATTAVAAVTAVSAVSAVPAVPAVPPITPTPVSIEPLTEPASPPPGKAGWWKDHQENEAQSPQTQQIGNTSPL